MGMRISPAMNVWRFPTRFAVCVHAFSIHEQRMSFPLDSIRQGGSYTGGEVRREIAYPRRAFDVGGGYGPGDQGKGLR
nr:DUF2235 domain-containing protein [Burkholderia multivorans]